MAESNTPAVMGPCTCGGYGIVYDAATPRKGYPCHEPLSAALQRTLAVPTQSEGNDG